MSDPTLTPQYESGGGKLIAGAVILVIAALSGILWSLTSRQQAPQDAPAIKSRFLPPSARPEKPENSATAVPPVPTLVAPAAPTPSPTPSY